MNKAEIERLRISIVKAKEALSKELLLPEDASQLRRMISYYEEKIQKAEQEEKV